MITLVRYSYHELRNRWTGKEYVVRPSEGPHSILDIVDQLELQLETLGVEAFIKPYLLFPWSEDDVKEAVATLQGRLAVTYCIHYQGEQIATHWQPVWFYPEMGSDIVDALDTARTKDDLPHLAFVEFSFG